LEDPLLDFIRIATLVAALAGTAASPLVVVDESGKPVAGALVDFVDAAGRHDLEKTDPAGNAVAKAGFDPRSADVRKPGFSQLHVDLDRTAKAVLQRALPVVGTVSVATGSRRSLHEVPFPTSVMDRSEVALSPAQTSDGLLSSMPGNDRDRSNSAFTNYGQARASFSGAGLDRGDVLVDGVPAQDAFGGQVDWLAYPAEEIERAELLRGAGSALYGSGAVGGVLDIRTFAPEVGASGFDGRASAGLGTNDAADDSLQLRTPLGPNFAGSLSAVSTRLAYFSLPPGYAAPSDHISTADTGATHLRGTYRNGSTTVNGSILATSDHQDEGRNNYTFDRTLRQESVDVTQAIGAIATAKIGAYVRDTTVYNLNDLFPTKPGVLRYDQHVPTNENGFFGSLSSRPGPLELALIVDQRRVVGSSVQTGATGALQSFGAGTELSQGVGGQATFRTDRFEALAGIRADTERYDDLAIETISNAMPPITKRTTVPGHDTGAISPRGALRYDLSSKLALRVSSGGGFRSPYLNELIRSYQIGTVVMAPNPNLAPERSTTSSAGLDYAFGAGRLSFDVTQTQVKNAIDFVTVSKTLMMRENVDRTQTNGETLTYTQSVATCARVRASGTVQNPRITSGPTGTDGMQLSYIPNRAASIGLDVAGPGPIAYSIDSTYSGQTYADELEQEPLGPALLFGGTIRATTASGISFTLAGDNVTNQRYLSTIDRFGPPLTVIFKVGVPIGATARERVTNGCRY
jgi:outer membrane cobalamin receptor